MDATKKRINQDLPEFFMKYDDPLLAREHLVKIDANRPNTITHFCAVPLDMVAELKNSPDFDPEKVWWPLKDMTVDRLSKLLTQLGRSRNGMTKKQMITMIESLDGESLNMQAMLEKKNLKKANEVNCNNKAVMRFVNVMFSPTFQKKFEDINNSKSRSDFEFKTEKKLFAEIAEHINDDTCGFHDDLLPCEDFNWSGNYNFYINEHRIPEDMHPKGTLSKPVNGKIVMQIYTDLVRVRKQIIAYMTQSGSHDGATNPWSYVVNAIKKCKLNKYCPLAVFYFYMQCLFHKGIAEAHTHCLKDVVKHVAIDGNSSSKASTKKDADNEFMKSFCIDVGNEMKVGNSMRKDELNERKLYRLAMERNSVKKSIDSGNAKRIKLLKEYRKCTDDLSKKITMSMMEDVESTLIADKMLFDSLGIEMAEAKVTSSIATPVAAVTVLDKSKDTPFPISEITFNRVSTDNSGNTRIVSGENEGTDSEYIMDMVGKPDEKTITIHDDTDDSETMI